MTKPFSGTSSQNFLSPILQLFFLSIPQALFTFFLFYKIPVYIFYTKRDVHCVMASVVENDHDETGSNPERDSLHVT